MGIIRVYDVKEICCLNLRCPATANEKIDKLEDTSNDSNDFWYLRVLKDHSLYFWSRSVFLVSKAVNSIKVDSSVHLSGFWNIHSRNADGSHHHTRSMITESKHCVGHGELTPLRLIVSTLLCWIAVGARISRGWWVFF